MFESSEDYDFTPVANSNLSSLFDNADFSAQAAERNLIYTAPKQPAPKPNPLLLDSPNQNDSLKSQSTVICAQVVTLWKLENNQYTSLGKQGIALVSSPIQNELILYKNKENVTSRTRISTGFTLTHRNEFVTFYDHAQQQWLLQFQHADAAKFFAEVEKLGGKNVYSTTTTGSGSVAATEPCSGSPTAKFPATDQRDGYSGEDGVVNHSSDSSVGSRERAAILSRMAKMGQAILPPKDADRSTSSSIRQSGDASDSDDDDLNKDCYPQKHKIKHNKKSLERLVAAGAATKGVASSSSGNCLSLMQSTGVPLNSNTLNPVVQQIPYNMNNQFMPNSSSFINSQAGLGYDPMGLLFAENRAQHSDVRMNLTNLSLKLDQVMKQVTDVTRIEGAKQTDDDGTLRARIKAFELKTENLTNDLSKSQETYLKLEDKFQKQEAIARSTEMKLEESERLINSQNERIEVLQLELLNAVDKNVDKQKYETEIKNNNELIQKYSNIIETQTLKIADLEKLVEVNRTLTDEIDRLNKIVASTTLKVKELEELDKPLNGLEASKQNCEVFTDRLKQTMNKMYASTVEQFDENVTDCSTVQISNVLAKNIKLATFKIIEDFQSIYGISKNN